MRTWADDFNTFSDACRFYGCDTPEQMEAEADWFWKEWLAGMEAEYGPYVVTVAPVGVYVLDDEIPF